MNSAGPKRFVQPPLNQFNKLRRPLTAGEQKVFDFFNKYLPPEWEIYIEPHLNGLRPDFVLLHPEVGIGVFEIKDWNLKALQYYTESKDLHVIKLKARKDARNFLVSDPIEKVHRYKQEIFDLYCPRLDRRFGKAAITAGVIFPFSDQQDVERLLLPIYRAHVPSGLEHYYPLIGRERIDAGDLFSVFPAARRKTSRYMSADLAKDLRNWLVEPDFAATQRISLELDNNQKRLATTRTTSGYRRIKGPAGSGKSLVLAARAAQLASEGKDVLVVTYNITLLHLLMDMSVRWKPENSKTRSQISWLNFHSWCKRTAQEAQRENDYKAIWSSLFSREEDEENSNHQKDDLAKNSTIDIEIPHLINSILNSDDCDKIQKYDAIIVDEGQDFMPEWWNALRKVCNPGGEMILSTDTTQDVYGTSVLWTDQAMKGAGFAGDWTQLSTCYRMPPKLIKYSRQFAESFLPRQLINLPEIEQLEIEQLELELYPCELKWIQVKRENAIDICVEEILHIPIFAEPMAISISDITFISDNKSTGIQVVDILAKKGVKSIHTFDDDDRNARRLKLGFFMGDARVKATTLHSFKGWESRVIVLYISHARNHKSLSSIYTGLTRLKRHPEGSFLIVICSADVLRAYGRSWSQFQ